jgi:RNA recognition motif-containing protein
MSVKVFVGNLPFSITDDRLKEEFSKFGAVESARVVTEKHTGRSRGYGFVEFADQAAAEASITGMNGQSLDSRPLTVSIAKSTKAD